MKELNQVELENVAGGLWPGHPCTPDLFPKPNGPFKFPFPF
ncbi:class IIb bacteriocin, lactobin A/cerein 7B family [Neisseria chenwenguii]|nr:class IIb bacteriocin, lactobin A/cerein 7B family [Neisseria chenwenguii]